MPYQGASYTELSAGDGRERRRALLIGVDEPARGKAKAGPRARAIADLRAVLLAADYEVVALHHGPGADGSPDRTRVVDELARLARDSDEEDLIVVYAACPGARRGGRPHLRLTPPSTPTRSRAVPLLALADLLDSLRCKARSVGLFLDVNELRLDPAISGMTSHSDKGKGGFAMIVSGGSTRAEAGGSSFTRRLIDGLDGAAADQDGAVWVSALADHIQDGVARTRLPATRATRARPLTRLEVSDMRLRPPRPYRELTPRGTAAITSAAVSADGTRVVTGAADGGVCVWDARTGVRMVTTAGHRARVVGVGTGGIPLFCSAAADGTARTWFLDSGGAFPPGHEPLRLSVTVRGFACTLAQPGTLGGLLFATDEGVHAQLVDDTSFAPVERWTGAAAHAVGFCQGGFVTGGADGRVVRWRPRGTKPIEVGRHDGPVTALAVSGGVRVATGGPDAGGRSGIARLWDLSTRKVVALPDHPGPIADVAFSPDPVAPQVATACADGVVRIFDAAGRPVSEHAPGGASRVAATALAFAPDGKTLFVGYADGRGRLFAL